MYIDKTKFQKYHVHFLYTHIVWVITFVVVARCALVYRRSDAKDSIAYTMIIRGNNWNKSKRADESWYVYVIKCSNSSNNNNEIMTTRYEFLVRVTRIIWKWKTEKNAILV